MIYAQPGSENAIVNFKSHYDNFIGGEWVKPTGGEYFDNISPINGQAYCKVARFWRGRYQLSIGCSTQHQSKVGENQRDRTFEHLAENRRPY